MRATTLLRFFCGPCPRLTGMALASGLFFASPAATDPSYPIPYPWEHSIVPHKSRSILYQYITLVKKEPDNYFAREVLCHSLFANWRLEKNDNTTRMKYVKLLIANAREMVKMRPNDAAAYHWLGAGYGMGGLTNGVLNSLQLVPEIKKAFEKSMAIDPNYLDGSALVQMARVYMMLPSFPISIGNRDKALEYLKRAKKMNPRFTLTYLYLADLYWSFGEEEKALAELENIGHHKPQTEVEYFLNNVNADKANQLRALIKSDESRNPFYDVLSDIQPGLVN